MKSRIVNALLVMLLAMPVLSHAQTTGEPVIYKNWEMLIESPTLIDVSYRVIKCDAAAQIHLMVFNENTTDQTAHFDLEITNTDTGEKFTKEISFAAKKATVFKALCDSDASLDALKINLPDNYNPKALTLKLTFKP